MFIRRNTLKLLICVLMGSYFYIYTVTAKDTKSQTNSASQTYTVSQSVTSPTNSVFPNTPVVTASGVLPVTASIQKIGEYLQISFDILGGYEYREFIVIKGTAYTNKADQIPQNIKSLNEKKVTIRGYFYPMETGENGTIKSFLLLRNQIYCCFGDAVQINEWLSATMANEKTFKADFTSRPVTLYGKLEVGELRDKDGSVISLYRMKADKIVEDK